MMDHPLWHLEVLYFLAETMNGQAQQTWLENDAIT